MHDLNWSTYQIYPMVNLLKNNLSYTNISCFDIRSQLGAIFDSLSLTEHFLSWLSMDTIHVPSAAVFVPRISKLSTDNHLWEFLLSRNVFVTIQGEVDKFFCPMPRTTTFRSWKTYFWKLDSNETSNKLMLMLIMNHSLFCTWFWNQNQTSVASLEFITFTSTTCMYMMCSMRFLSDWCYMKSRL